MEKERLQTIGYWVYAHTTPNGLYYIGMSKTQPCERWRKAHYKTSALAPYITEYGWENIQHKVLIDGLTKEQAEAIEDWFIRKATADGFCINKHRSGGFRRDNKQAYYKQYNKEHKEERKAYDKQYREDHKEERQAYMKRYNEEHKEEKQVYMKRYNEDHKEERKAYDKQYDKQRLSTPEGKIYNRVKNYNRYHPDKAIETPMEAKQKYLETGYIPTYIKHDDII